MRVEGRGTAERLQRRGAIRTHGLSEEAPEGGERRWDQEGSSEWRAACTKKRNEWRNLTLGSIQMHKWPVDVDAPGDPRGHPSQLPCK